MIDVRIMSVSAENINYFVYVANAIAEHNPEINKNLSQFGASRIGLWYGINHAYRRDS